MLAKNFKLTHQVTKQAISSFFRKNVFHVVNNIRAQVRVRGERTQAVRNALMLLQYDPRTLVHHAARKLYCVVLRVKSDFNW